jgi:hypothetical protein
MRVMTTSPTSSLRLQLNPTPSPGAPDGAWWPRSRDLHAESADLVDHFPHAAGHINRLLYSRPDWDDATTDGRGVRRIVAARGPVKTGSFPRDDTHLMVLTMATGHRLKLLVIPSDTEPADAERLLGAAGTTGS